MVNYAIIQGNMTADPELRQTQSGLSVLSFSIARTRTFESKATGERETDFFDCVAWRKTAEFIAKNFHKGKQIIVEGELQTRSYEDSQGNKRRVTELIVNQAHFAGWDKANNDNGSYSNAVKPKLSQNEEVFSDDDLPF